MVSVDEYGEPPRSRDFYLTAGIPARIASAGRSSAAERMPASSVGAGTFDVATRLLSRSQVNKRQSPDGKVELCGENMSFLGSYYTVTSPVPIAAILLVGRLKTPNLR
jgi:hypothetical protein